MFDLGTYTAFHTILSLIALVVGIVVVADLLSPKVRRSLTVLFLITAIATSVTGFGFPFHGILPSHILAVIALIVLAVALYALYSAHLHGVWRSVYAVAIVASLYFLVFVGIAQAFGKIPLLHVLAPNGSEPPFAIAELVALVLFIAVGYAAARSFRRAPREALA
jgi:hypothetical protein